VDAAAGLAATAFGMIASYRRLAGAGMSPSGWGECRP
jgi:hypothetical protein